jgi:hypothetical protein
MRVLCCLAVLGSVMFTLFRHTHTHDVIKEAGKERARDYIHHINNTLHKIDSILSILPG